MFIDPDGREVKGVNQESANKIHEDMNTVFADKKFDAFRGLLTRGRNNKSLKFDKINEDAFKNATSGLKDHDLDAATSVYNAINSKSEFVFEYLSDPKQLLSESGNKAYINSLEKGFGDSGQAGTLGNEKRYTAEYIYSEGTTVKTDKGAHAFINDWVGIKHFQDQRALTSFHEGFGHGIPFSRHIEGIPNQHNAIHYENMIRKVMGITIMRDGANHGGGAVKFPTKSPSYK